MEYINLHHILFIDIETVPLYEHFNQMNENMQVLWTAKTQYQRKNEYAPSEFFNLKGGIFSEFAKIVCISVGFITQQNKKRFFRVKSFFGHDEKTILEKFKELLDNHFDSIKHHLCAHNGKEFDYPFIARRMIINNIKLPKVLNIAGKKPWEVKHLDTMEMWKFGDYKHYTSIKLLAEILNIPTPKDDIDGSQVAQVYWKENDIKRIVKYCEKDTLTVAQIYLKFNHLEIISKDNIIYT